MLLALTMTVFALEEDWEVISETTAKGNKQKHHATNFVNEERDEDEMTGIMYPVVEHSQDNKDCGALCEKCMSDRKIGQSFCKEIPSHQTSALCVDSQNLISAEKGMLSSDQNSGEHSEALCEKCIQRQKRENDAKKSFCSQSKESAFLQKTVDNIFVDEMTGIPETKYTHDFQYTIYNEKEIKKIFEKWDIHIEKNSKIEYVEYKKELRERFISWYNYAYENRWYIGMTCLCFTGIYGFLRLA